MKILGCDYDGTLNYGGFDDEKIAALKRWQAQGHKLGVVSGRGVDMLSVIQDACGVKLDFFVGFNGAVIYTAQDNHVDKVACAKVRPEDLTRDLFAWGCDFAHVNSDKYYLVCKEQKSVKKGEYTLDDLRDLSLIYQVSIERESVEAAAQVAKLVQEKYGEYLTPLENGRCVDIVPKGVGKAYGMDKIRKFFFAEQKDVIVVGDNLNDVDMLKAFYSYAMENGVEEIKKIATHTTKSVTELIARELEKDC